MTRRGDRDASQRRSGIGEDERQPVMVRLASWWRRFNLVILVTLMKENHPGEAYVRRNQRKALYRDSLDGSHEKAEIQRKASTRGKNLTISEDTYLEKERVRLKETTRKVGVGLKRRWELNKRRWGWRLLWWEFT